MSFKVQQFDLNKIHENISCQSGCPVSTNAWKYISLIREGKFTEAFRVAREPNPFASICGRICTHPCEVACRRGNFDEPISIRALKRVAEENSKDSIPALQQRLQFKEKIAVIGGGPTGLTAAYYLQNMGYRVTVFESTSTLGGMLWLGVPEYRLPRETIQKDIENILSTGIEVKLNTPLDETFTLSQLRSEGFDAIYIAVGTQKAKELNIQGKDFDGVLNGIDFLLNINKGYRVDIGQKVVVIGGGDVAVDVARTVLRQSEDEETLTGAPEGAQAAVDAARTALRLGAKEVHIMCVESREEMPATGWEIHEAEQEGIIIHNRLSPKRILGKEGQAIGIETLKVQSVFDGDGNFNPTIIPNTENVFDFDTVIMAVGQRPDLKFLNPSDNIELRPDGTILIDLETLQTSVPGIFAGGDVAFGPRNVIEAVADGKKAADAIHDFLSLKRGEKDKITPSLKVKATVIEPYAFPRSYHRLSRQPIMAIPVDRRIGISEVEMCYTKPQAHLESTRCLRCHIFTIFDSNKCILCGGCIDVCPTSCLRIADFNEIEEPGKGQTQWKDEFAAADSTEKTLEGKLIIKDEELCIQCGMCYHRCPVDAITMESFEFIKEDNT